MVGGVEKLSGPSIFLWRSAELAVTSSGCFQLPLYKKKSPSHLFLRKENLSEGKGRTGPLLCHAPLSDLGRGTTHGFKSLSCWSCVLPPPLVRGKAFPPGDHPGATLPHTACSSEHLPPGRPLPEAAFPQDTVGSRAFQSHSALDAVARRELGADSCFLQAWLPALGSNVNPAVFPSFPADQSRGCPPRGAVGGRGALS